MRQRAIMKIAADPGEICLCALQEMRENDETERECDSS